MIQTWYMSCGHSACRPASRCITVLFSRAKMMDKVVHWSCSAIKAQEWEWRGKDLHQSYNRQEDGWGVNPVITDPLGACLSMAGRSCLSSPVWLAIVSICRRLFPFVHEIQFRSGFMWVFFSFPKNYLFTQKHFLQLLLKIGWLANLGTVCSCSLSLLITLVLVRSVKNT